MNNALIMDPQVPDLDKLFELRGGFAMAMAKLRAYAIIVIKKRSGLTKNGRAIANLDAQQLVINALSRLTEMPSFDDGESVYLQLRRHIDNEVRTLQKKKHDPSMVPIAVGTPEEGSFEISDPEDYDAINPADAADRALEDDFCRDLLGELKKQYKSTSHESRLIDLIVEGWSERKEIAELMNITPEQYDAILKKVGRSALALKEAHLKRTAL